MRSCYGRGLCDFLWERIREILRIGNGNNLSSD